MAKTNIKSIIIPVYKNEESIPALIEELKLIKKKLAGKTEVVFVVDGSPDKSYELLNALLPDSGLNAQLIALSRNFGSYAAIKKGLEVARGEYFGVMAADLQEPPELIIESFEALDTNEYDVVVGARASRVDHFMKTLTSQMFWFFYKKCVVPDMPAGGVDIFSCNQIFREQLLHMDEAHSSLIAQIFCAWFQKKNYLLPSSKTHAWRISLDI